VEQLLTPGAFIFIVLVGLTFGSFANVCIHRLPDNQSVLRPRSRCPRCFQSIAWRHNLPILSFLWLRGRCAHCRAPIAVRYPAVEILCAALFAAVWWKQAPVPFLAILGLVLSFYLVVISFIDWDLQIIPDVLSLSLLGVGLLTAPFNPRLGESFWARGLWSVAGVLVGGGLMIAVAWLGERIWKKEALGGGDVKLMAAFGALMGPAGVFTTLFIGSLSGSLYAGALLAAKRLGRGSYVPFGPFLAVGAWVSWLWLELLWGFMAGGPGFFFDG